ncbi:MAG: YceI family protein [Lewinellaceae bacterium]|nr:YceI family protein [Saprospiraceae bacterium]MCB9341241.1 YceI family protein [Lewinellaceae bacterium]
MAIFKAEKTFHLEKTSTIKLEGSTNFDLFYCKCAKSFAPQSFALELDDSAPHTLSFQNTSLRIPVVHLDCGNPLMNKEMFKALNGKRHPDILIELVKIWQPEINFLDIGKAQLALRALVRLSINGQCHEYWLLIHARQLASSQYRFQGTKTLCMSEFGIAPPTAMLGIVKVKDEIKIDLDLEVRVE